jgi:hypothetical protein
MSRTIRLLGVAGAFALAVGLAACAQDLTAAPVDEDPTPTYERFDERQWTIATPSGWTREVITPDADAEKAIRYNGPNGEYFIVAIDPMGSDYAYDALWRYEARGDRFRIVDRYECAGKDDESCSDGDARYDGYILWKNGEAPSQVGGHTWYFVFGNQKTTSVDAATFEEIAESIRVTV